MLTLLLYAVQNGGNSSAAAGGSSRMPKPGSSSNGSAPYPPGSYCQRSPDGSLVCGVDMLYCCFGSDALSSTAPVDWQQRLLAGTDLGGTNISSPNASGGTMQGRGAAATGAAANATGGSTGVRGYVIALSVTLPVVAIGAAIAVFVLLRWAKGEIRRKTSGSSDADGSNAAGGLCRSNPDRGLLDDADDSSGITSRTWGGSSRGTIQKSRFVSAFQTPRNNGTQVGLLEDVELGTARSSTSGSSVLKLLMCCINPAADRHEGLKERSDTAMLPQAGNAWQQRQQQHHSKDASIQLSTATSAAAAAADKSVRWQQQQPVLWQQQDELSSSVLDHNELAFVYNYNPQQLLVWSLRHRGRTLPDCLLVRALDQFKTWQQQQQQATDVPPGAAAVAVEKHNNSHCDMATPFAQFKRRCSVDGSSSSSGSDLYADSDCSSSSSTGGQDDQNLLLKR